MQVNNSDSVGNLMNTSINQNNVLTFVADLGLLFFVMVVGTIATVWFLTQPQDSQRAIIEYATNLTTKGFIVLLAQPGVFLTYKIASGSGSFGSMPTRRRIAMAISVFVGLAFALPTVVGVVLHSFLSSL